MSKTVADKVMYGAGIWGAFQRDSKTGQRSGAGGVLSALLVFGFLTAPFVYLASIFKRMPMGSRLLHIVLPPISMVGPAIAYSFQFLVLPHYTNDKGVATDNTIFWTWIFLWTVLPVILGACCFGIISKDNRKNDIQDTASPIFVSFMWFSSMCVYSVVAWYTFTTYRPDCFVDLDAACYAEHNKVDYKRHIETKAWTEKNHAENVAVAAAKATGALGYKDAVVVDGNRSQESMPTPAPTIQEPLPTTAPIQIEAPASVNVSANSNISEEKGVPSATEKMTESSLSDVDKDLNQTYKKLMAALDKQKQADLKREELIWIRAKDKECGIEITCLKRMTAERLLELKSQL